MLWAVNALEDCSVREEKGRQSGFAPERQPGWGTNNFSVPISQEMQCSWDTDPTTQPAQPVQLICFDVVITTCNSSQSHRRAAPHLHRAEIKLQRDCLTHLPKSAAKQGLGARSPTLPASHLIPFPVLPSVRNHSAARGRVEKERGGRKVGWWETGLRI